MIKERVFNLGIDFAAWRAQRGDSALTPNGLKRYHELISHIKGKHPINLSEYADILDGYDFTSQIQGLEKLEHIKNGALILSNHTKEGPLKGDSNILATGFHVARKTGREIRWMFGVRSSPNNIARPNVQASLNFILVDGKKGRKKNGANFPTIMSRDLVGLYPEGDNDVALRQGKPEAGRVIHLAAKLGVPTICVSVDFNNGIYRLTFNELDNQHIITLRKKGKQKLQSQKNPTRKDRLALAGGQEVVNYAMATIALPLPPEKRGYYHNPERFFA